MRPPSARSRENIRRVQRGLRATDGSARGPALATAACFSARQFHRLALQITGETPGAHQRRRRLDHAAWRLRTERTTILQIALDAGFASHESFLRAFRRRFRVRPSHFRRAADSTLLPPAIRLAFYLAHACQPYAKKNP